MNAASPVNAQQRLDCLRTYGRMRKVEKMFFDREWYSLLITVLLLQSDYVYYYLSLFCFSNNLILTRRLFSQF
jgi:hypothetical protein